MKARVQLPMVFLLLGGLAGAREPDAFFDDLDDALTWSTQNGNVRMHLSGLADLEYYHFQQPPPGLMESDNDSLVNPRLTLFLDGQFGSSIYVFVQARVDRGFDPNYEGAVDARLDEYALRYTPEGSKGYFNFQLGKFATVVGNWVSRHQSWTIRLSRPRCRTKTPRGYLMPRRQPRRRSCSIGHTSGRPRMAATSISINTAFRLCGGQVMQRSGNRRNAGKIRLCR